MTNYELDTEIAVRLGYSHEDKSVMYDGERMFFRIWRTPTGGGMEFRSPPSYSNDLNAIHDVLMSRDAKFRSNFRKNLQYLIAPETKPNGAGIRLMNESSYDAWFHATARQRAESLLETLNIAKS